MEEAEDEGERAMQLSMPASLPSFLLGDVLMASTPLAAGGELCPWM